MKIVPKFNKEYLKNKQNIVKTGVVVLVFVIHDAVCSGDKVMFAESVEAWLESCRKKNGPVVFEKRGELDTEDEFGRLHRLGHDIDPLFIPKDFEDFKRISKELGWESYEPDYVTAYTLTPDLVLSFGG